MTTIVAEPTTDDKNQLLHIRQQNKEVGQHNKELKKELKELASDRNFRSNTCYKHFVMIEILF
jgi:hypothetical protein